MGVKRTRVTGPRLGSWEEADERLHEIGLIDVQIEEINQDLHTRVAELKEAAADRAKPLQEQRKTLEHELKEFVESRRNELEGKSRRLNFGTVGFRKSTKLMVRKVADTLRLLKELGLDACIRIKESVDKEELRKHPDELLRQVGVKRKEEDVFYIEVDVERVRDRG